MSEKAYIQITASFHITLKDENHTTQAHIYTRMTFTPAASLEDDYNNNSKVSQRKGAQSGQADYY
jgi:hypothetical protein